MSEKMSSRVSPEITQSRKDKSRKTPQENLDISKRRIVYKRYIDTVVTIVHNTYRWEGAF